MFVLDVAVVDNDDDHGYDDYDDYFSSSWCVHIVRMWL